MSNNEAPRSNDRFVPKAVRDEPSSEEAVEHSELKDCDRKTYALANKVGALTVLGICVLVGSKMGLDYWAKPEQVQERQDKFMREIQNDGRYNILTADEDQVYKVAIMDGTEVLFEPDPEWEDYISTVILTDGETTSAYVDKIIQYDGGPVTGKWTGISLDKLEGQNQFREIIDDPTPQRSDGLVWIRSDAADITSVPTEYASYAEDETDG